MRYAAFAARNRKELLRDPFSWVFGVGLPLVLLLIISGLQRAIGQEIFRIELFAPGIAIFGFSFITLFSGMLIAKDRANAFILRVFASPLTAADYIAGYALPMLPLGLLQAVLCFSTAVVLGLRVDAGIPLALVALLPVILMFIALGLLLGCLLSDTAVGGVTSILIQLVAFTSGMWFDLSLFGPTVRGILYALPFAHALDAARAALAGDVSGALPHVAWCTGYTVVLFGLAIWVFRRRMRGE
ncbi:MAG: ABC transporter permease [Clostridiaceae bacterium]|jgi:ABC-2 type transport system permease protein|nr:ABC transporter permease [Clostridiaceae bacterium]